MDLLSLASSPIARNFSAGPGQGSARAPGGGANSSHYLSHEDDDIAFDQSMRYTEAETPMHGDGGTGQ